MAQVMVPVSVAYVLNHFDNVYTRAHCEQQKELPSMIWVIN